MPCGCVTSPRINASNQPNSKRLGGMGVNVDCGVDDDDDKRGRCMPV